MHDRSRVVCGWTAGASTRGWAEQEGPAERAGMSEGGVRDLEQDHRRPSWETAISLAKNTLGVTVESFAEPPAGEPEKPGHRRQQVTARGGSARAAGGVEEAEEGGVRRLPPRLHAAAL